MTPSVVLDAAIPADAPTFARLNREAFAGLAGRAWSARDFEEILNNANVLAVLARLEASGEIQVDAVGYALLRRAADEAELLSIAVVPSLSRHGIGRSLVLEAARLIEAAGVRRLFLEVAENNEAAIGFYSALGFRQDGRRPNYYPATQPDGGATSQTVAAILMSAPLPLHSDS